MISELERQYSPSVWQKRFPEDLVVGKHIEITGSESEKIRREIPHERDIRYGPRENQLIDLYGSDLPPDAPLLVHVHGGYWQEVDKDTCANLVGPLHAAGIRVAVIEYDKAPAVSLPDIVEEMKEAAIYILNLASKLGSRGVWFSGHSAGAHLISCLLTSKQWVEELKENERCLIRGFILISGIYYIEPLVHTYINEPLKMTRLDAIRYSPFHNFKTLKLYQNLEIEIFITVGENESNSFKDQTKKFFAKLSTGYKAEMKVLKDIDHFNIIENLSDEKFCLTKEFIRLIVDK